MPPQSLALQAYPGLSNAPHTENPRGLRSSFPVLPGWGFSPPSLTYSATQRTDFFKDKDVSVQSS